MTEQALQLARILSDLHANWQPHQAQIEIIRAIFGERKSVVMVECGRKFGKTELDAYFLWRLALTRPGEYYYFTPFQNQGREIVWANRRLQTFGPSKYIESINEAEMRIRFKNGSFIKVDGSDNFDKYRGPNPYGAVYDEFRDFRREFHPAFGPNLATHEAPLLINGTPPERDIEHYDAMLKECRTESDSAYFNYPSWANPHVSKDWLRREKRKLYARGDGDEWEREYGAKKFRGGKNSILPMFDAPTEDKPHTKHVRPHAEIMAEIGRDKHKLLWQVVCDPGNASVFGVLFRAVNPYTKKVYRLDEIYEREQANTSTSKIIPRIRSMKDELYPGWRAHGIEWRQTYDEAATWFQTEASASFEEYFFPTRKALHDKNQGISLLKDQLLQGLTVISDRCINFINEYQNYIRDANGQPIKENDHLIDCDRYGNAAAGLFLTSEEEPQKSDPDLSRRFSTPELDIEEDRAKRGVLSIDKDLGIDEDFDDFLEAL